MRRADRRLRLTACALWLATACAEQIDVAAVPALSAADADASSDAGTCAAPSDVLGSGATECTGDWLAARLGQALCSCEDFISSAGLGVGAFDASGGRYVDDGPGGDVRIDGALNLGTDGLLRGGLAVAGTAGVALGGGQTLHIEGPLAVAGDLDATAAALELLADAEVGGQLLADSLQVSGTLTMTDPARLQVSGTSNVGSVAQGTVQVVPSCRCDAFEPAPTADESLDATDTVEVCGRRLIAPLESEADVEVRGAGVLEVDGDVGIGGRLTFDVPTGGELFVIVRGNLRVDDGLVAMADDPRSRVHLLIAGNGTVQLSGETQLTGSLYAPLAELVASGPVEIHGALLVRRAGASAQLDVHFDTSLGAALQASCP